MENVEKGNIPDIDFALYECGDIVLDYVVPWTVANDAENTDLVFAVAGVREVGELGHGSTTVGLKRWAYGSDARSCDECRTTVVE